MMRWTETTHFLHLIVLSVKDRLHRKTHDTACQIIPYRFVFQCRGLLGEVAEGGAIGGYRQHCRRALDEGHVLVDVSHRESVAHRDVVFLYYTVHDIVGGLKIGVGVGVGETAYYKTADAVEYARAFQAIDAAVDSLEVFVDILDEENRVFDVAKVVASSSHVVDYGEVATDECAFHASLLVVGVCRHFIYWKFASEDIVEHHAEGVGALKFANRTAHVGVDAHHTLARHCAVDSGDVAVSGEPFGVLGKISVGEKAEELYRAITAAPTHNSLDSRCFKCPFEVGKALLDGSGECAELCEHVGTFHRDISPGTKYFAGGLDIFRFGAGCRADNGGQRKISGGGILKI